MQIQKAVRSLRAYPVFVTKSQVFEITDYSFLKNMRRSSCIQSDTFIVGGYEWAIEFYPKGDNMLANSESVAVRVRLINPTQDVEAVWTHCLRDWNTSEWSTGTPTSFDIKTFSSSGSIHYGHNLISRSNLEASKYLKHDKLMIKTTLWVVKKWRS
ncbi:BTB/POZ and MATH domain-containing protein 3-like [Carex rostrata]